ncbi:hypothetical protein ACLOJK_020109 [Asimina triloba]
MKTRDCSGYCAAELIDRIELLCSFSVRPGLIWCGRLRLGEQIGVVGVLLVVVGNRGENQIWSGERTCGWSLPLEVAVAVWFLRWGRKGVAVRGWLGVRAASACEEKSRSRYVSPTTKKKRSRGHVAAFSGDFRSSESRSRVENSTSASETGRESFDRQLCAATDLVRLVVEGDALKVSAAMDKTKKEK